MVIVGNDKISAKARKAIADNGKEIILYVDKSTDWRRLWKIINKRKIGIGLLVKMFLSEFIRPSITMDVSKEQSIETNNELLKLIERHNPDRIFLFRAGLIINKKVIACGKPLLNIHCAKVPEFGGLGSIQRALDENALEQYATLHQVTTTIDQGEIFAIEPYVLDKSRSYFYNEDTAYDAGIRLLINSINSNIGLNKVE